MGFEARLRVGPLFAGEVRGEILDVDLESRRVRREQLERQAALLDEQDGLVAVPGQCDVGRVLARLVRPR
jgi:hypothetical protein